MSSITPPVNEMDPDIFSFSIGILFVNFKDSALVKAVVSFLVSIDGEDISSSFFWVFSIYFGKNLSRENNNKLNISFVMKKRIGSSVIRNKIKRRLRSAIQKRLKNKKFIDINYSYIIFGKSKTFTEKYSIISDELDKTFFKINQINNQNEVH